MYIDTEGMQRAANTMRSAAEQMQQTYYNLDGVFNRHERFMDDWLLRLERILLNTNNERHVTFYDGRDISGYSKLDGGSAI